MKVLVLGGTRFFGIHLVDELLKSNCDVTIATRGLTSDSFGNKVKEVDSLIDTTKRMEHDSKFGEVDF